MPELLLSLNLSTNWILHILYSISHWQLQILAPPLDFSPPKSCHWGGGGDCPPAHHAAEQVWSSQMLYACENAFSFQVKNKQKSTPNPLNE